MSVRGRGAGSASERGRESHAYARVQFVEEGAEWGNG